MVLAKEAGFVGVDGDEVQEVLASREPELTNKEWTRERKERIQTETRSNSEQPASGVIQGTGQEAPSAIIARIASALRMAGKYDFNFERTCMFREVCRMFSVHTKNCMLEKCMGVSSQATCPVSSVHTSHTSHTSHGRQ